MVRFEAFEALGVGLAAMSDLSDGDCSLAAPESRQAFLARCGLTTSALACVRQVHGTKVLNRDSHHLFGSDAHDETGEGKIDGDCPCLEADGLVTRSGGALGITVADCVPILLAAPGYGALGLLHAGREGTRGNIAGAGVAALEGLGVPREALHAFLGPSAGPCCYEVSAEIARDFGQVGLPVAGRCLDLWAANRRHLEAAGVPPGNIVSSGHCTICGGGFHSYRATGAKARNLVVISG